MANNLLGVDYGSVRVGLALSPGGESPRRLTTIKGGPAEQVIDALGEYIDRHSIDKVIIGLPRNLDGDDTPQTAIVRDFVAQASARLQVEFVLQDEAGTSEAARERLASVKGATRGMIDAEAAVIILEDYLNA